MNQRPSAFGDVHRPQRAPGNRRRLGAPRLDQVDRSPVGAPRRIPDVVRTFRAEGEGPDVSVSYIEEMEPCSACHTLGSTLGALAHERDGPAVGRPRRLVIRLGSGGKTIDA